MINYSQSDIVNMTDSELDAAFAVAYDTRDGVTEAMTGTEIAGRLAGLKGMIFGLINKPQFPLYSARLAAGYGVATQTDSAQTAVVDSAKAVASNITFGFGAILTVVGILGIAYILFKVKK